MYKQNQKDFLRFVVRLGYKNLLVVYTPNKDVNNSAPILIEIRQPQTNHAHVSQPIGETHEMPLHNLADFEPCLGYATEGQAVGGIPLQNTFEGP